jgi:hypothetical protein
MFEAVTKTTDYDKEDLAEMIASRVHLYKSRVQRSYRTVGKQEDIFSTSVKSSQLQNLLNQKIGIKECSSPVLHKDFQNEIKEEIEY